MENTYITTYSKIHFVPWNPDPNQVSLVDIAHALSLLCRGNGHSRYFYSVGQHSIHCAKEAKARGFSKRVELACLLHDGSEAYLSDITRPVKQFLTQYQDMEKRLQQVIYQHFSLSDLTDKEEEQVKKIDDILLYHEFWELFHEKLDLGEPVLMGDFQIQEESMKTVEHNFLEYAQSLLTSI